MIRIDLGRRLVTLRKDGKTSVHPMESVEAFELVSEAWIQCGWDVKYPYTFSWFGRPIIQMPEDLVRLQEVLYHVKPDVVLETGIAHGGSLVFYASLLKAMGKGHVIGVDVEIRSHNRQALDDHPLRSMITLIEGSSIDKGVISEVKSQIRTGDRVFVVLDSNHTKSHVAAELNAYADLVSVGSYLIAADGIMRDLVGAPRSNPDWDENNPRTAVDDFVMSHPEFVLEAPAWPFNESVGLTKALTYLRGGWLRRVR
jgi:cephalosporin hydroxylase